MIRSPIPFISCLLKFGFTSRLHTAIIEDDGQKSQRGKKR